MVFVISTLHKRRDEPDAPDCSGGPDFAYDLEVVDLTAPPSRRHPARGASRWDSPTRSPSRATGSCAGSRCRSRRRRHGGAGRAPGSRAGDGPFSIAVEAEPGPRAVTVAEPARRLRDAGTTRCSSCSGEPDAGRADAGRGRGAAGRREAADAGPRAPARMRPPPASRSCSSPSSGPAGARVSRACGQGEPATLLLLRRARLGAWAWTASPQRRISLDALRVERPRPTAVTSSAGSLPGARARGAPHRVDDGVLENEAIVRRRAHVRKPTARAACPARGRVGDDAGRRAPLRERREDLARCRGGRRCSGS